MIDPKLLRQSAADVAANLARRGFEFDAGAYLELQERRKSLQVETEALQNERNTSAKSIGKAKAQGEDIEPLLAAVKDLGDRLAASETSLQAVQDELRDIELGLPNLLADDVPTGNNEDDNTELRRWGDELEHELRRSLREWHRDDLLPGRRGRDPGRRCPAEHGRSRQLREPRHVHC